MKRLDLLKIDAWIMSEHAPKYPSFFSYSIREKLGIVELLDENSDTITTLKLEDLNMCSKCIDNKPIQ